MRIAFPQGNECSVPLRRGQAVHSPTGRFALRTTCPPLPLPGGHGPQTPLRASLALLFKKFPVREKQPNPFHWETKRRGAQAAEQAWGSAAPGGPGGGSPAVRGRNSSPSGGLIVFVSPTRNGLFTRSVPTHIADMHSRSLCIRAEPRI